MMTDHDKLAPVVEAMADAVNRTRATIERDIDLTIQQASPRPLAQAALTAALPLLEGLIADWLTERGHSGNPDPFEVAAHLIRAGQWRLP